MRAKFSVLARRTMPCTSYPCSSRNSARYEPSWPVIPVMRARRRLTRWAGEERKLETEGDYIVMSEARLFGEAGLLEVLKFIIAGARDGQYGFALGALSGITASDADAKTAKTPANCNCPGWWQFAREILILAHAFAQKNANGSCQCLWTLIHYSCVH